MAEAGRAGHHGGRWLLLVPLAAIVAVVIVAAVWENIAPKPESLIVLPGATDVRFCTLGGTQQVGYRLKQAYPAKAALSEISARLKKQGWQPLKEDFLNPGQPSSHVRGWTEFMDGTRKPEEWVHQWLAQWKNAEGDMVWYDLRYRATLDKQDSLDDLRVCGIYLPAKVAEAKVAAVKRAIKLK